ncbi:M48 family metallopeptidase [Demequina flava]|uniref:M48 family metallopeptidase n=1 Tax=Demequina flava TaxID=1095025 RepID=UPI000783EC13|nr:YgjP-like metallopeptidase domain-containing protein [Demequina flava]
MNESTPEYTLTRKKGMRRVWLRVVADGSLAVSAPYSMSRSTIDGFVRAKSGWIEKRRSLITDLPPQLEAGPEAEQLKAWIWEQLDELMPMWCERMGVDVEPRVSLKIMTSRWGSCNAVRRRVSLNVELGRRGRDALEYVLVHELAHLFESNHGLGFYAIMDRHLPDWKARRAALRSLQKKPQR